MAAVGDDDIVDVDVVVGGGVGSWQNCLLTVPYNIYIPWDVDVVVMVMVAVVTMVVS
jgi:hypothetical protein